MTIQSETPQATAVAQGILEAYQVDGYITDSGAKNTTQVREAIFEAVRPHKVLEWGEREDKAITRGEVTQEVFPSLPGPGHFEDTGDPQLAAAVWAKIDTTVWSYLQANAAGPVQRLVGINMGNGYVLVRTQIGVNSNDAVYITDDLRCIERDFLARDNKSLQAKIDAVTSNREMLILRQPDNAKHFLSGHDRQFKALGSATHDRLALAVEAATASDDGDDNPDDGPAAHSGTADEPFERT